MRQVKRDQPKGFPMTKHAFAEFLPILAGMPSTSPWSDGASALYTLALGSWDDSVGRAVLLHAAKNCRWRPSPAELREIAIRLICPVPSQSEVRHEIGRFCNQFSDPARRRNAAHEVTNAVVDWLGGWLLVGYMDTDALERMIGAAYAACVAKYEQTTGEAMISMPLPSKPNSANRISSAKNELQIVGSDAK